MTVPSVYPYLISKGVTSPVLQIRSCACMLRACFCEGRSLRCEMYYTFMQRGFGLTCRKMF